MGCILGIIAFIWKAIKFVFGMVVHTVGIIVDIFIDIGLAIPFLGAVTLLVLWLTNTVTPATDLFLICWGALAVLTVLNIIFNIRRRKRRRLKEKEKKEAFKRFEQEQKEKQKQEKEERRNRNR